MSTRKKVDESKLKFVIYALVMFELKIFVFLVPCSSAEELMKKYQQHAK